MKKNHIAAPSPPGAKHPNPKPYPVKEASEP